MTPEGMIHPFVITDGSGRVYKYKASDLRMALAVHQQVVGTEAVSATYDIQPDDFRNDLGNDPDGDLDGYDGPIGCTCGPWASGGRDVNCPIHADQNRQVLGYTDE